MYHRTEIEADEPIFDSQSSQHFDPFNDQIILNDEQKNL